MQTEASTDRWASLFSPEQSAHQVAHTFYTLGSQGDFIIVPL